ncbi:MAG: uracil-xanthine permease [Bacilli bacterium]|nr:uracil-xanthine permease [Bacilli bacterium]
MKKKNGLILDVDEKPSMGKWIVLSLQHVFAMFGATILVPILVNNAAGEEVLSIPVTLVASGIGTLLYQLCTKSKSPVYLGSSFAFITPMILAFAKGGKGGVFTGIMAVGLAYILIALIIKIVGTKWLEKLLPPIIIGPMIMIIGLGLAPTAISSIGIEAGAKFVWQNVLVALITFLTTAFVATRAKGFFKVIPFLIGIVAGYVSSCVLGLVDFTPIKEASFFSIPAFQFPFVNYDLDFSSIVIMVPIVLVTISEHIGDHTVLGTIIGKDLIKDPGLARTLLGDGLATFVAGFIGGPSNTTYGENTSVVGMSKIASIWVLRLAAIFAIILAFLGKFTALASTIPNPVLGGVSLLLYGFISVNGLKVLVENQVDFSKNKNVIVSAAMLVIGLGGATISISSGDFSLSISGMVLAAIIGIVLNLVLKEDN